MHLKLILKKKHNEENIPKTINLSEDISGCPYSGLLMSTVMEIKWDTKQNP